MNYFGYFLLIGTFFSTPSISAELVMFESEACEWCEVWDEEIGVAYSKTSEANVLPLRKVDIDGVIPADYEHLKGLVYTPTFVVMDKGKELGRIIGYPGEDFFWQYLKELLLKVDSVERKKYESF